MAFNEALAERIRKGLARRKGIEEKKMFGGIGFLLSGNLLVGVWKDSLIVRLGDDQGEEALKEPHVSEFNITGRSMKGWVLVAPEGVGDDDQLSGWIQRAVKFVGKLPGEVTCSTTPQPVQPGRIRRSWFNHPGRRTIRAVRRSPVGLPPTVSRIPGSFGSLRLVIVFPCSLARILLLYVVVCQVAPVRPEPALRTRLV
jgi:hypothetical protein